MSTYLLDFQAIDKTMVPLVGGKGANLGELCRIDGIHVPDGFCLTTELYKQVTAASAPFNKLLAELSQYRSVSEFDCAGISSKIRKVIGDIVIPASAEKEIEKHLELFGVDDAYAIRSSATAEDLPAASFAGQQDTYLNITGKEEIVKHIKKCWASLFTERGIYYRLQHGFEHKSVHLAVIIQKMIFPEAAGILFTADPVTSNRKISSIDAGFGLGEAMVSGWVNADNYSVCHGNITGKRIAAKTLAVYARENGGTVKQNLAAGDQNKQVLSDGEILTLERLGRRVEAHFDCPQDIEWCLSQAEFYIVQSRPVTTVYPVPETGDREKHVYISVGHQQMMTDAIKPLGLSIWQLTAARPMYAAGGRLFVDVMPQLSAPVSRDIILNVLGKSDPLIKNALSNLIDRGDFITDLSNGNKEPQTAKGADPAMPDFQAQLKNDPSLPAELIRSSEKSINILKQEIRTKSGTALFDFIKEDCLVLRQSLAEPKNFAAIMTGMNAYAWLNEKINEWLGEKNAADTLSQSVRNNITAEMGLELLDVADVIRAYPQVISYLQQPNDENFPGELHRYEGGPESQRAIDNFLEKYGMRCAGEIDITRTRWQENPSVLIPLILNNIRSFEPGEAGRKFGQGQLEASVKEQELLRRIRQLPDGEQKAEETERMISLLRNFIGYREYPKYSMVSRYFIYRQALLKEAESLTEAGIIPEKEAVYYLALHEFRELVRTRTFDQELFSKRKSEYQLYEKLSPPRVLTSDGETITGKYNRDNLPDGSIAGLAVSGGMIEGRARVVLNMAEANMEEGDILVTAFTDPSWTPLFIAVKGLVTEVGGLMTHGAVIAREYGLPAVVGVENATRLIKDGQRIRVNGSAGYVEIL